MRAVSYVVVTGLLMAILAGCGGGWVGSTSEVTGIVSGTAYAPSTGRQAISGQTKLSNATVQLINLADGSILQTTTTDSNGYYRCDKVKVGLNVRVVVVKTETNGQVTRVEGVVPVTSTDEVNKDLDVVTTVASQALEKALAGITTGKKDTAIVKQALDSLEEQTKETYSAPGATLPTLTGTTSETVQTAIAAEAQTKIVDVMPKITVTGKNSKGNDLSASIYLDGVDIGQKTPLTGLPVRKGYHTVTVKQNNYRDASDSRDVQSDTTFAFTLIDQPKPKLTSAEVSPTSLSMHGGTVALTAKVNDTAVTSVVVTINKAGGTGSPPTVTLTADDAKTSYTGSYTADGNGKTKTDYYTVTFTAKGDGGTELDALVRTLQVVGLTSPPGKPGF